MAKQDTENALIVKVEIRGKHSECQGVTAKIIAYLAEHEAFFNDPRTMGNFSWSLKDNSLQIKNDISIQS